MTKTIAKPKPDMRADGLHARRAGEAGRERIRDLVIHILRRTAGPVREDDDLLLADVGDGIHPRVHDRVVAHSPNGHDCEHDEERVFQTPADEAVNHGQGLCWSWL